MKEPKKLTEQNSSEYLRKGYKQQNLIIRVAEIEDNSITGVLDIKHPFKQYDGSFHLPSMDAYNFISQLVIAYGCHHFGKSKDELGQFVEHEQKKKSRKPITKTEGIVGKLDNIRFRRRGDLIIGSFDYDIENGAVVGWMKGVLDAAHEERYKQFQEELRGRRLEKIALAATSIWTAAASYIFLTKFDDPVFWDRIGRLFLQ
ncbi:hypothetical protein GOV06_04420 [Candidatus Woesearchaeota archaeon]|nr:hypothetical protein [Candidatus Woesearchaeota archaeon]